MSEPSPESEPEVAIEAGLALRRTAVRGFFIGAAVATAVFVSFALLPGTDRPMGLYVGLAVVLGLSVGLLATAALVGWRVRRLSREL